MEVAPPPPTAESKLHFLDYWRIISIRKWHIIGVFLLVVVTTTLVTLWMPKTYSSFVRIEVEKDDPGVGTLGQRTTGGGYDPYYIETQFQILQSSSILTNVIQDLGLNEKWAKRYGAVGSLKTVETQSYLIKRMQLRPVRNTTLIDIRVFSEDKEEAAVIANKIAEVYHERRINDQMERYNPGLTKVRDDVAAQKMIVDTLKEKVDRLRSELKVYDFIPDSAASSGTLEPETLRRLEADRVTLERDAAKAAAEYEGFANLKDVNLQAQALVAHKSDELLVNLLRDRDKHEQELAMALKEVGEQNPLVLKFQGALGEVRPQITNRVQGILLGMKAGLDTHNANLATVLKNVEAAKSNSLQVAEKSGPYFEAKREYEHQLSIKETLERKLIQEEFDAELPRRMIRITDPAMVALFPVRPKVPLNIALGVVLGLIVGVGLAFFVEYLDTSVKTIDDVERALQAAVVGVIPQNVGSLLEEGDDSPHAEAYRVLRTNILFARKEPTGNALTIVSGGAGEGKSTTIFNLAVIFAQNGHRVLLIDSDLRRPSLHKILKVSNSIGLTNYLLQKNTLPEVIQTTPQENLDFLPSGKLPSSAIGILNSQQMRDFVKEVKKRYDYVFFDSPPVLGVSDASIIVSEVDMALLVVQYRKYPQAMTVRAKQTVEKYGNLLGVVLNNINIAEDSNYYYYSGYYYSHYSRDEDEVEEDSKKDGGSKSSETKPANPDKVTLKQKY